VNEEVRFIRGNEHTNQLAQRPDIAEVDRDDAAHPRISFTQQQTTGGKSAWVPNRLPRLDATSVPAAVELPLHLNWSSPGRVFDLRSRADRARVYEIVLQEGQPDDVLAYVDGVLLADLWNDLALPRRLRAAWEPLMQDPGKTICDFTACDAGGPG